MTHCDQRFNLQGVVYACEREQDHGGDHVYAFTAGQLQAVLYRLQHPTASRFPGEAVVLIVAALVLFLMSRAWDDKAMPLLMFALGVRWLRQHAQKG